MKRFILFIFLSLLPSCLFAQLVEEGFEGSWPPTGWAVTDNGIGNITWEKGPADNEYLPPYTGTYAAYLNKQNVTAGTFAEDWLITPQFTVPENAQLRFFSHLTINLDQGSIYEIRVSSSPDQLAMGNYTILQSWTELEINPVQQDYVEKIVELPSELWGTNVYIAFVMRGDDMDRWLIDDVRVAEKCVMPENLTVLNVTETTANLSWDNPSGATEWEIELVPADDAPTGSGDIYNSTLPFPVSGLTASTLYKYYVKAVCTGGIKSDWAGPYTFSTVVLGATCDAPLVIPALPYTNTGNTLTYGNEYSGTTGTSCGTPDTEEYLAGYEVVYAYTPNTDKIIQAEVTDLNGTYAGIFVYTSCANVGTECFGADFNGDSLDNLSTGQLNVVAGQTYYFVISTSWASETTAYTINIQEITCPYPVDLQATNATTNNAHISWSEFGGAVSWQYVLQPPGTGTPIGEGTVITTEFYDPAGLTENTSYEFYVRAVCSGSFSQWAGPITFSTLCAPVATPFTETFNSDSPTQDCWVKNNISGAAKWSLDYTAQPFEGDESAGLDPEFMNGNIDWLITPPITLPANQRLRFHQKVNGFWGSESTFKVMLSTTGNDPEDFTTELLPSAAYSNSNYVEYEIYLNAIPAGTVHIAWIFEGGTGTLMIDNVIVDPIPPCPDPEALTVTNITTASAQLAWTAGYIETEWQVVVQAPGSGIPTTDGVTATNPYPATGLTPNTAYEYYVRAVCGGTNGNSNWVGPYTFSTACNSFNVPFIESFDSTSATTNCWTVLDVNGGDDGWQKSSGQNPFEGDGSALFNANFSQLNDDWLISPAINLTGNERLSYQYRANEAIYPTAVEVLLSTTGKDPEDFTAVLLPVTTYNNNYYIKKVLDLSAYSGTVYIAWHGPNNTNDSGMYIFIDDVRIEALPTCADPFDLAVADITTTTAKLSWTPGNDETQWEIVVKPTSAGEPTEAGIITSENPYTVTGLSSGTKYSFYIRAVCGDTNSIWNGPVTFVTAITNDECENAIPLTLNTGTDCTILTGGSLKGSTESAQPAGCGMVTASDVWFEFTAAQEKHNITILNISSLETVHYAIYKGTCGATELVQCSSYSAPLTLEGLTIGENYKLRVYSTEYLRTTSFDVCLRNVLPPLKVDNTTYTVEQLVNDVLINSECAQISNITYSTGTNFTNESGEAGPNGIAYFEKNGSAFAIEKGILLTTGNAMQVPGPETGSMEAGDKSWPGDEDLNAIVLAETGLPMNSTNATILEFDFVPLIDQMSFDFLFASEEYGTFQCDFSDSFAFLLTDSSGTTTNVALVPDTDTPVSVVTIRDSQYNPSCSSENVEYFGQYNEGVLNAPVSATNFLGHTVPMTAKAIVVPNTMYHIKMVIADRGGNIAENPDTRLDSGVFLAGGSFNIGNATLGPDLTIADKTAICANGSHTIESGLSATVFTFKWFKNDVELTAETGPNLIVTAPGIYKLEAQIVGADCIASDSVLIEFYAPVETIVQAPANLVECSEDGVAQFDLTENDAVITGTLDPADLVITYHLTQADAIAGINPITSPYETTAATQTIYVHVAYGPANCTGILSFTISKKDKPLIDVEQGCDNGEYKLRVVLADEGAYTPENVTIEWLNNKGDVVGTDVSLIIKVTDIYTVTVTPKTGNECPATGEAIVDSVSCDIPRGVSPNNDSMNDEFDLTGFDVKKLTIYNRYGQEVYSKTNYTKEWTGQGSNGDELPTGTYFYSIERTNGDALTGWVYLNRQD